MTEPITKLIRDVLRLPDDALSYEVSVLLGGMFPDCHVLMTEDCNFDLKQFAALGRCSIAPSPLGHGEFDTEWSSSSSRGSVKPSQGLFDVDWQGERIRVLMITYGGCGQELFAIFSPSKTLNQDFFATVCKASSEVRGEILVFAHGYFERDQALLEDIGHANLDNLILEASFKEALVENFDGFFASEALYRDQRVPWKRGVLLLGPPGNGKTHAIKAMVRRSDRPCIYVRTFVSARGTIQGAVSRLFAKARSVAPCMIVLEDLDSLIDDKNRSFFLNEMDGFASNHGLLTVATTNHPERLDPALLERPSRFDRKLTFGLPKLEERKRFLAQEHAQGSEDQRLAEFEMDEVASRTEGFSFAYLKELRLSALMAWMRDPRPGGFAKVLFEQIEPLRAQMKSDPLPTPVAQAESEEYDPFSEVA